MPDLLLEIGVEELPAAFGPPALAALEAGARRELEAERLPCGAVAAWGTPRRLALLAEGVAERQEDREEWVRGPSVRAAFDAEGRPTRAALGFASGQGVAVEDLERRDVPAGAYVFARRVSAGRPALDVLAEVVPRLVGSLDFPRSMRWGAGDFRFARPVRWLLALFGGAVVPCSVAGLEAGRTTYGQRTLAPGALEVAEPSAYRQAMRAAFVLVDPAERRAAAWQEVCASAEAVGGRARNDDGLLDEVAWLLEWPTGFCGRFPEEALALPEEVLVTVMRVHQRYFPVEGPDGRLLPHFAALRNGGREHLEGVVAGNEKVLRARLADARFFHDEDRRRPLADRVEGLQAVAYAAGLGTMRDRVERIRALAARLAGPLGAEAAVVDRAALLCKADRLTHLVYELPELEGTMGAHYARADGEPEAVAEAIGEHVLPRAAGDELPRTPAGRAVALADKLDGLAGQLSAGRAPTGSADPFGLRRMAVGALRILAAADADLPLDAASRLAAEGYAAGVEAQDLAAAVATFLQGRLRVLLDEAGYRHDVVDAVLAAGLDRVWRRVDAVARLVAAPTFADVLTAFRRAARLAGDAAREPVRPDAFRHAAEGELWEALQAVEADTARLEPTDYQGFFAACARLRPPVDAFLEAVLVMDPDPAVRSNRLALLGRAADLLTRVADLSRLAA